MLRRSYAGSLVLVTLMTLSPLAAAVVASAAPLGDAVRAEASECTGVAPRNSHAAIL